MEQSIELSLLEPDELEQLNFIWDLIPAEDKKGMTREDVLFVLDAMDDYLEQVGLAHTDEKTGEVTYEDGDVDETEQLEYLRRAVHEASHSSNPLCHPLTSVQIQLIMDGEMQYGIRQGWYEE